MFEEDTSAVWKHAWVENRDHRIFSPEKNLWVAVLDCAIRDLRDREFRDTATSWFTSDRKYVGSFLFVCHALSIDPTAVRKRVLSYTIKTRNRCSS